MTRLRSFRDDYIPFSEELFLRICDVLFPSGRIPCPLCHGAGRVFQRPREGAGAAGEAWEYALVDEYGQTRDDLLAQGYVEVIRAVCAGSVSGK